MSDRPDALGLLPSGAASPTVDVSGRGAGVPMPARSAPVVLFGIPLDILDVDSTLDWIIRSCGSGCRHLVTSNLDFARMAWEDPEMHRIHVDADLVVADGMPLIWLSRFFGPPLPMRVAGSDLVPRMCEPAGRLGKSIYALGAAPGVAQRAMDLLRDRHPGLRVAGCDSPSPAPLEEMNHEEILSRIGQARPDILLVAFGAPKQEKWIRKHRNDPRVPLAMGVGASLDFVAGVQIRAPKFLQRAGLEWVWRLALQPRRLFKRYAGDLRFLGSMLCRILMIRVSPLERVRAVERPERARIESLGGRWTELPSLQTSSEAAQYLGSLETRPPGGVLVVDVSRRTWLNSLELGVLLGLARRNRVVVLAGAPARVIRLIRLFRLDRFLRIPACGSALEAELAPSGGAGGPGS